ncbi:MAG: hypothetical protein ACFFCS_26450 [Candidatus Hodarchaeota archaeon]
MGKEERVPEKHFKLIAILALVAIIMLIVNMILTNSMHMIARAQDLGWNLSYITLPTSQAQTVLLGIVPAGAIMAFAIIGINIHNKNEKLPFIFGIILSIVFTVLIVAAVISGIDVIVQGFEVEVNRPLVGWFIAIGIINLGLTPLCILGLLQGLKVVKYGQDKI